MSRRLPPLNALRAFEAAGRLGSFAKAAEELAVTATAISHQIRTLEDYLGEELFERLPRGLRLTAAGEAYLPELTFGFNHLARAEDRLKHSDLSGPLTISVLPSFCACWLAPRILDFHRRYPEIRVHLLEGNQFANFQRDRIDIALRFGQGGYPGLRTQFLMHDEVFPAASPLLVHGPAPLREWADLRHHTLLEGNFSRETRQQWMTWRPWLNQVGLDRSAFTRDIVFSCGATMMHCAVQGFGVILARTVLASEHLREGRLIPLFGVSRPTESSYYAVMPESHADRPRVRAFVDWLLETIEAES